MFHDFDEARRFVSDNDVKMVDLKFCDLWGRWHHLTVPADQFTTELTENGVGFDASSVGLKPVKAGDMVLVPDLPTGFVDPFWQVPTLSFICSAREADTRLPFPRDPRNTARRAEEYLCELGIADESRWGPEFEFYIFNSVAFENEVHRTGYRLESAEGMWNSPHGGLGHYIPMHGGYHAIPPKDSLYNLRSEMCLHLEAMGVPVKYHHHEVGGPGQSEIETPMMGLLDSGDATMLVKYVTKMTAAAHNQTVTFMPKPLFGEAGNGMHFHQLLMRDGLSLFYDPDGYAGLSQMALYYIGGLLTAQPGPVGPDQPKHQLLPAAGPWLRSAGEPLFLIGQPQRGGAHPQIRQEPDDPAVRIPPTRRYL